MVFLQVQTIQQGPYKAVVCITAVILYNGQVADPQQGSFVSPLFLTSSISTFSRIFKTFISCVYTLVATYFIQSFLFPYLMFLLALLSLNLLLTLVLPLILLVSYMPFMGRQLYSRVQYACLSRPLPQFSSSFPFSRPKGLGLSISSQLLPPLIQGILLFSQISYNRLLA